FDLEVGEIRLRLVVLPGLLVEHLLFGERLLQVQRSRYPVLLLLHLLGAVRDNLEEWASGDLLAACVGEHLFGNRAVEPESVAGRLDGIPRKGIVKALLSDRPVGEDVGEDNVGDNPVELCGSPVNPVELLRRDLHRSEWAEVAVATV